MLSERHEMIKINQPSNIKDMLNEPLAIVGMNCQFPGIDVDIEDDDAFHKMLVDGQTRKLPRKCGDYAENRRKSQVFC